MNLEDSDIGILGEGQRTFRVTIWGDTAPKVMIGVKAKTPEAAADTALTWGRDSWWRDRREIGIHSIEEVIPENVTPPIT